MPAQIFLSFIMKEIKDMICELVEFECNFEIAVFS